jgi:membrane protease subunit HflK
MKWTPLVVILALAAYAATGVYTVGTDQRAIVRRFGRVIERQPEPGLSLGLPWGMDRVELVKPGETKTVTIGGDGLATASGLEATPGGGSDSAAQFLTGDQNLVNVRATVQFMLRDPRQFLFGSADPARVLTRVAEAAISATLARESIDFVLTTGKDRLAARIEDELQKRLDPLELGVDVRSVSLIELAAPPQVADAFTKAASARSDRERLMLELEDRARADHDRVIDQARGDSDRFTRLVAEYRTNPRVAATRLYLEMIADILPKFRSKLIVDSGPGVDLTILRAEP